MLTSYLLMRKFWCHLTHTAAWQIENTAAWYCPRCNMHRCQ
jgi:hypothetical protein